MTQRASRVGLNDSRLVRLLSDLGVSDVAFPSGNLSQRLGGRIDFKASMRLAAFHDELRTLAFEPSPAPTSAQALKEEVLQARLSLMRTIVEGFVPGAGPARLKLPTLAADISLDRLLEFEPYHRFYAAHQRALDARIQTLQLRVREVLTGRSAELARLAAMDAAMRDIVSPHTRTSLAVIPQLLSKRFDALVNAYRSTQATPVDREADLLPEEDKLKAWTRPDGWLGTFCHDMQQLLLAELDLRLVPILGLVEAVDEEVMRK